MKFTSRSSPAASTPAITAIAMTIAASAARFLCRIRPAANLAFIGFPLSTIRTLADLCGLFRLTFLHGFFLLVAFANVIQLFRLRRHVADHTTLLFRLRILHLAERNCRRDEKRCDHDHRGCNKRPLLHDCFSVLTNPDSDNALMRAE